MIKNQNSINELSEIESNITIINNSTPFQLRAREILNLINVTNMEAVNKIAAILENSGMTASLATNY